MTDPVQEWLTAAREVGCIIPGCDHPHPCELHHPRDLAGAGQKSGDVFVIPLCTFHHRGDFSVHGKNRAAFFRIHGTELQLLELAMPQIIRVLTGRAAAPY